jgi:hypothetical protein
MNTPDRNTGGAAQQAKSPLELTIKPAASTATGGQRLPVQFTLRNNGDQAVHTCLSQGRVVHLWDRQYAYTVAQQSGDHPTCEEAMDLPPHSERSWSEEIAVPAIAASSAKLVGFAQILPDHCEGSGCQPAWLTASFAPFTIEPGEAAPGPVLDLRTGAKVALASAAPAVGRP